MVDDIWIGPTFKYILHKTYLPRAEAVEPNLNDSSQLGSLHAS